MKLAYLSNVIRVLRVLPRENVPIKLLPIISDTTGIYDPDYMPEHIWANREDAIKTLRAGDKWR